MRAPARSMAGFWRLSTRGRLSQVFPHPEPWQSPDAQLAEQARNRDHHSGDPPDQAYKQQKVAQEKRHTRLPATSPYRATLPFHHVALRSMPDSEAITNYYLCRSSDSRVNGPRYHPIDHSKCIYDWPFECTRVLSIIAVAD